MNEIIQCQIFSNTIILLGLGTLILLTIGITASCLISSYKKAKRKGSSKLFYKTFQETVVLRDLEDLLCDLIIPMAIILLSLVFMFMCGLNLYNWIHYPNAMILTL